MIIDLDAIRERRDTPNVTVTIRGQEHHARPVGVSALNAFIRGRAHPSRLVRTYRLRRFLRAAFPWRWAYFRPGGDPVGHLMRCTPEKRGEAVAALLVQVGQFTPTSSTTLENLTNG